MYIYKPIRDGRQYDVMFTVRVRVRVILSPVSDWLMYVHRVPSILEQNIRGRHKEILGPIMSNSCVGIFGYIRSMSLSTERCL